MKPLCIVVLTILISGQIFADDDRPNIVLIMADDMGFSDIGCYGGEIQTPNIDSLAEGGLRFTQFYNTGRCCPTRASLMTGLYPHASGVGHMVYSDRGVGYHPYLNKNCVTIAEALGSSGYRTMMAGKWHVGHQQGQWPTDRGFQHFYGIHIHVDSYFKVLPGCPVYYNDQLAIAPTVNPPNTLHPEQEWYTTDVFTDWSIKFLKESQSDERPFFLYTAYNSPHWPLEAPQENIDRCQGRYEGGWDVLRAQKLQKMKEMGIVQNGTQLSPSGCPEWSELTPDDQQELAFRREIYAAQIERMDENIGRIIQTLRESEQLDHTLIFFLSDNGCCAEGGMFGYKWNENSKENFADWRNESGRSSSMGEAWSNASNTPFRMHKRWVHEGGIATPLIAHWPQRIETPGGLTHQPGHVIDILATCLDVADAAYPEEFNGHQIKQSAGKSLVPAFLQPQQVQDRTLFWEHEAHAAMRDGDWKLVTLNAHSPESWELYNLSEERTETNDLRSEHPERVDSMIARWTNWAEEANVLPWPKDRPKKPKK
ncbi:arylsulfatase [Thalassoglobus sp. JC818]|uniref:arylsulfatase n=1 Tax=Thalassoglobus sp. JC818 TaxID=3232136 RepID=UPI003457DD17